MVIPEGNGQCPGPIGVSIATGLDGPAPHHSDEVLKKVYVLCSRDGRDLKNMSVPIHIMPGDQRPMQGLQGRDQVVL